MRTFLLAAAAVALTGASTALAAGPDANIALSAENPRECHITSYDSAIALTPAVDTYVSGNFQYQCNFVGSPTLTFSSANGGLVNGTYKSDYGIYLNDAAVSGVPSSWQQASTTPKSYGDGGDYGAITGTTAPNTVTTPNFAVGLSQPLEVAGTYTDTLTISIAP